MRQTYHWLRAVIGWTMMSTIIRDLTTEFQKEFPDLTIEFV